MVPSFSSKILQLSQYQNRCVTKRRVVYQSIQCQQRNFDEGAAEVKRLLQRDRKELTALENSLATEFTPAKSEAKTTSEFEPDTDGVADSEVDTSNRAISPFGEGYTPLVSQSPFNESSKYIQPDPVIKQPWWQFLTNITLGQLVIGATFTTMISLMFGTFYVVLTSGGISFND